jgi:hypothetical protein
VTEAAPLEHDLSGAVPGVSYFSRGSLNRSGQIESSNPMSFDKTNSYGVGDVITIIADLTTGTVDFFKNRSFIVRYRLSPLLRSRTWYCGLTLPGSSSATLLHPIDDLVPEITSEQDKF